MPQQEPGWGRIRPLARETSGGNKMFPAGRVGWGEPVLGQDLQPGLSHQRLSGPGSHPAPGVWGSHGVWMGFSSHAGGVLGAKVCVPPLQHRDSGASPHHPGGSRSHSGSPPWWRQQLSRTLFWMFMGFQFTPGSEAAKLPSQGGVIPRMRPVSLMCRGAQPWPPSPCAVGGSFGSSACQGAPSSQHQKIWSK